eukprot:Phypoly_transcript_10486.p1 GENE.Phypoly_transcript_10486~~Phypoly_transcript_10486.p1  ORF type:complete len:421 (+),score=72.42 Phypoly_transcript_10486:48-1265(+)
MAPQPSPTAVPGMIYPESFPAISGIWNEPRRLPEGRLLDPLPSSLQAARILFSSKETIANAYARQCNNVMDSITTVRESKDNVVRKMEDYASAATTPQMKELYLNAMRTAEQNFLPAFETQHKILADLEAKYIQSLQDISDCVTTISWMEEREFGRSTNQVAQNLTEGGTQIGRTSSNDNTNNNTNTNNTNNNDSNNDTYNNTNNNNNSDGIVSQIKDKPEVDMRLQMLMPHWAEVKENDANPHHFAYYHRFGQGFNFEGWDDDEKTKLTAVIYETHREAESEIERHCERHTDWDEQYPKLFIDFPAFLANTSGCGTAFGKGRVDFVDNIYRQILDPEFRRILRSLGEPKFSHIKAIVITAKKGPLKGNRAIEAQYYDNELVILWNDLDNIAPNSISFNDFESCL